MKIIHSPLLSLLLGLLTVSGFAPFSLFPVPVLALAILFRQWQHADNKWAAARLGFAFGLGLFGAGVGWIYVALHDYGGMPSIVALLATALFVAFLALLPTAAAYLQASVVFHSKRYIQRTPERPAARRACAGIAILFQASATRRMAAQGLAQREPPKNAMTALRRLAIGWLLPARHALSWRFWEALNVPFRVKHYTRWQAPAWVRWALCMPALWVLLEWLRGLIFTGFPWLTLGYTQVSSPLAGYAPVFGVYGVSLAVALSAGLLAGLYQARWSKPGRAALLVLVLLWGTGAMLRLVEWTQPAGEPFQVSLVQGNIPQQLKFREEKLIDTLETYRRLVLGSEARLIVLPETALPLLSHELPTAYLDILRNHARQNGADILFGAFEQEQGAYYNSVLTLGSNEGQRYRKNHLVPFGEFIPLRPVLGWFISEVLHIPMSDLTPGGARQALLNVAGQQVAVDICYEDVFGEEVIRYLPQASVLVNVSNDAWYGHSHAAIQHNQIAQMRALESGRMMLRATNTGATSIIGRDGTIRKILPQHEEGVLTGAAQGYSGSTPYVRWGNAAVLGLLMLMLMLTWKSRCSPAPSRENER